MPYYPTIDQDLARAREILERGSEVPGHGAIIHGLDIFAAYMLLKSFVEHITYLHEQQNTNNRHIESVLPKSPA